MNHVDQQKVRLRLCRTWHVFSIRTLDPSLSLAFVLHIISSDSSCEWSYFIIEISLKDHSGTKKQRQKSNQSPCSAARVAKNPCASTTCIWAHETDAFAEKSSQDCAERNAQTESHHQAPNTTATSSELASPQNSRSSRLEWLAHIIQDNVQVCIACAHLLAAE